MRDTYLQRVMDAIEEVPGYPFDEKQDEKFLTRKIRRYPEVDHVAAIDSWIDWLMTHPFEKNANHRLAFNTWCQKSIEFKRDLRRPDDARPMSVEEQLEIKRDKAKAIREKLGIA
jgi:hypothetical protein